MDATSLNTARRNMVEYQIRCCKILVPELIEMLMHSPREKYTPTHVQSLAYMEGSVPLPAHQEMLTPLQEAQILKALNLQGTERILEIGTGTGYLTSLLAVHADEVVSCEIHLTLADLAIKNLKDNGIDNAKVVHVNAMDKDALTQAGVGKGYDVVILGAAVESIPPHILELINENAQLIAFVGQSIVTLEHHQINSGENVVQGITETRLLPMEGMIKEREFVF